ncbi:MULTISPECIES: bifunctional 2-polyprenyl-6-hydroxyphenol methylase/3-demethylubiquinol 3-O-methyltransferase UbiG [unclassified Arenibacter]|jgi:2-polyprenyl-3-methyl-5-hydroxy-6-metoxy-1,4-benzoquinol methylase|uniref:class I SAM-dependent methyltransferase n=1 Tax=unclassified Arenibacter TaxID=2615047 RepID=UPI000E3542B4|nr:MULTISPECIES: class I SAM-dependent methyltransferase [unclassified Arenibacter]MCM4165652.1 class I SAM-dependent methyltransferase [Arenibacter sp. A80]RFT54798.1 class I SAM-dependent methyltransferase [Arenibacter sp. P308M17]
MENNIIKSWNINALEWIKVIDNADIESRKFTNRAILQLIGNSPAIKVLDIGCGEGWLTRSLGAMGKSTVGLDAIPQLLENAKKKGGGTYYQMSYEDIILGNPIPEAPYDAAVFNFCLYQKEGLGQLLKQVKNALSENGYIAVQTLHPFFLMQNNMEYKSQWIGDSWKGLPGNFTDGHAWYARTFESWISVFKKAGLQLHQLQEVTNDGNKPLSVIFILSE